MNTQTKLSELDATKRVNLLLRQQLLANEAELFNRDIFAAYGNPGEEIIVGADGSITRRPGAPAAPPAQGPNGKGARKPGNR